MKAEPYTFNELANEYDDVIDWIIDFVKWHPRMTREDYELRGSIYEYLIEAGLQMQLRYMDPRLEARYTQEQKDELVNRFTGYLEAIHEISSEMACELDKRLKWAIDYNCYFMLEDILMQIEADTDMREKIFEYAEQRRGSVI